MLVAGGYDGKALSDVWCLDVRAQSWQQVRSYYSIAQKIIAM